MTAPEDPTPPRPEDDVPVEERSWSELAEDEAVAWADEQAFAETADEPALEAWAQEAERAGAYGEPEPEPEPEPVVVPPAVPEVVPGEWLPPAQVPDEPELEPEFVPELEEREYEPEPEPEPEEEPEPELVPELEEEPEFEPEPEPELEVPELEEPESEPVPSAGEPEADEEPAAAVPGRRRGVRVLAVLVALLVGVGAALGVLVQRSAGAGPVQHSRDAALDAARTAARVVFSYDYRHLDKDFAAGRAVTTGAFRAEYERTTGKLVKDVAPRYKAVVVADVGAAGVVSAGTDRVVALVFVDQQSASSLQATPKITQSRLEMTMVRRGGHWLVEKIRAF
jgi:Mce-associated membrane protein